jgi:hypothetical protein
LTAFWHCTLWVGQWIWSSRSPRHIHCTGAYRCWCTCCWRIGWRICDDRQDYYSSSYSRWCNQIRSTMMICSNHYLECNNALSVETPVMSSYKAPKQYINPDWVEAA